MKFVKESDLAKALGVHRLIVVGIRNKSLVKREDWKKDKARGRKILLTKTGVEKICAQLKVPVPEIKGGDEPCHSKSSQSSQVLVEKSPITTQTVTSGSSNPESVQSVYGVQNGNSIMQVHKLFLNPYMIEARDSEGNIYRVQVRSNCKLTIGDRVKAIKEEGLPQGVLRQVGALPRWKGDKSYLKWL